MIYAKNNDKKSTFDTFKLTTFNKILTFFSVGNPLLRLKNLYNPFEGQSGKVVHLGPGLKI